MPFAPDVRSDRRSTIPSYAWTFVGANFTLKVVWPPAGHSIRVTVSLAVPGLATVMTRLRVYPTGTGPKARLVSDKAMTRVTAR